MLAALGSGMNLLSCYPHFLDESRAVTIYLSVFSILCINCVLLSMLYIQLVYKRQQFRAVV